MTRPLHPVLKAFLFCFAFTGLYVLIYFFKSGLFSLSGQLFHAIIGISAGFLVTWLFLKWDRKRFRDIGLYWEGSTIQCFLLGLIIGIGLMGLISGSVIYFSGFKMEWNGSSNLLKFLWGSLPLLPLAFMEELGFRAYPFVTIKEKSGIRTTIYVTAILFAAYHLANGWTLQNAFLGAGVWGIIFGLAAYRSGGIALPTGLHYAVNMTTSAFGISSGSYHLWVLKQSNGESLANYQSSQLETLLPQLGLLLLGVAGVEWFVRRNQGERS